MALGRTTGTQAESQRLRPARNFLTLRPEEIAKNINDLADLRHGQSAMQLLAFSPG
jgi:hypothetical protein